MNPSHIIQAGKIKKYEERKDGIYFTCDNCMARIVFYSSRIARVEICQQGDSFEDFSYALIRKPSATKYICKKTAAGYQIATGDLKMNVDTLRLRFSFFNAKGHLLNEDDTFGTSWIGDEVTAYKKLQPDEKFIGLGEKTGPLNRRGNGYVNWNTDNFAYGTSADPLYSSVPFYIGIHTSVCYGVFFDSTWKTKFNFGASNNRFSSFASEGGNMNYYFIAGDSVSDVISGYTFLTGTTAMPPKWSLGYQQCRYSYYPAFEVTSLAENFRERNIPCDVIYLDIHYMDQYKIFTWDKKRFPDPQKLLSQLRKKGFRVVVICDPGIKTEKKYLPYDDGVKKDVFVKYPDGSFFTASVWPGECHFPDFTAQKTRTWWSNHFQEYAKAGVAGFWNDMNEIASWGQFTPENLVFDYDGNKTTHKKAKNVYGMQMSRATREGSEKFIPGKRPFILTRAAYSGIQRYSAVWTGDNVSNDEHMMLGCRLVNSLGLSGVAFAGNDIGGFAGEASPALFARWISIAAFHPFMRSHSMINSRDAEPWAFGEEVEEIARNYISLRYRMLPYLYSLFYEASQTGIPVARSLAIDFPHNERIYSGDYQNQFFVGPSILVAPVESYLRYKKVYFPGDDYYDLFTDRIYKKDSEEIVEAPLEKLPVFVKAASILVVQPTIQHTGEKSEVLEIHLYNGKNGSSFIHYEDDGESENGNFTKRKIEFDPKKKILTLHAAEGKYKSDIEELQIYFHGFGALKKMSVNNKNAPIKTAAYSFIQPISEFDPLPSGKNIESGNNHLQCISFPYATGKMIITW